MNALRLKELRCKAGDRASPELGTARNFLTLKLLPESDHVPTPTCAPSIALLVTRSQSQSKTLLVWVSLTSPSRCLRGWPLLPRQPQCHRHSDPDAGDVFHCTVNQHSPSLKQSEEIEYQKRLRRGRTEERCPSGDSCCLSRGTDLC